MPKVKKANKKSKRRRLRRKIKVVAAKNMFFFLALAFLAFFLEMIQFRSIGNHIELLSSPSAVIELDEASLEPMNLCYYQYIPQTLFHKSDINFLYSDAEVSIASVEKIDAEYITQALTVDEDTADVSYRLASLVGDGVTTLVHDTNGMIDGLSHIEKNDIAERKSYEMYEEDLPSGAVNDEFSGHKMVGEKGYFVHNQHKDIKEVDIHLSKKPYYFGSEPVIAVVIDDMGINQRRTNDIMHLKAPLTASFLTYGSKLEAQVDKAIKAGHEIIVHVPMEPKRKANLAPDTLTTKMDETEIKLGLESMLKKFKGVRGINNHMGSQFTEDKERMSYVMEILRDKNLFFLDSKTSAQSVGRSVAVDNHVSYAHRHVFLDNENDVEYIDKQLRLAEEIARRNGYVVAIGHPKSATYLALQKWLQTLPNKRLKLVHLSDIVAVLNPQITAAVADK